LQQGDVILKYNTIPVEDYRHVQRLVAETGVGRTVTLEAGCGPESGGPLRQARRSGPCWHPSESRLRVHE
jgi:hypothetical protein